MFVKRSNHESRHFGDGVCVHKDAIWDLKTACHSSFKRKLGRVLKYEQKNKYVLEISNAVDSNPDIITLPYPKLNMNVIYTNDNSNSQQFG